MIPLLSKAIATLITLLLFVAVILPVQATVAIGEEAPDFTAVDSNGVTHKLSDHRGSTVVLEWTNHECPYTVKHYKTGNMQALQKEATDNDIVWLSVISSAPGKQGHVTGEQANALTESRDASPTAVLLDPEGSVGRLYGARTTPHMYIIDPEGKLAYMGGIDDNSSADPADVPTATNYVRVALDAMAAGETIDPASTRPYGCSVKY